MLRTAGLNVFNDNGYVVIDTYVCTSEDTVRYARDRVTEECWASMTKMALVDLIHNQLLKLREVD